MFKIADHKLLLIYLIIVNIICLWLFFVDKKRAQSGRYRIRERDLFLWALAGEHRGAGWACICFATRPGTLNLNLGFR